MGRAIGKAQVVVYMKPELHQQLRRAAFEADVSVSELVTRALSRWSLKKLRRRAQKQP